MQVVKTVVKLIFLLKSQFDDKDIAELNLFKKQNKTKPYCLIKQESHGLVFSAYQMLKKTCRTDRLKPKASVLARTDRQLKHGRMTMTTAPCLWPIER